MVQIDIVESLFEEIEKKFKKEASKIYSLFDTLKENSRKGKPLGTVGGLLIKEIKYKSFRFYFIVDGFKLKVFSKKELTDLLLRFVRMSDKKYQKQTINEIKVILTRLGPEGFR